MIKIIFMLRQVCVADESVCKSVFTRSQCSLTIVNYLCPYLCGDCSIAKYKV